MIYKKSSSTYTFVSTFVVFYHEKVLLNLDGTGSGMEVVAAIIQENLSLGVAVIDKDMLRDVFGTLMK